jgi:hypothetical protein
MYISVCHVCHYLRTYWWKLPCMHHTVRMYVCMYTQSAYASITTMYVCTYVCMWKWNGGKLTILLSIACPSNHSTGITYLIVTVWVGRQKSRALKGLSRLRIAFYALHKRGSRTVNGISPRFESFCVCRLSVSLMISVPCYLLFLVTAFKASKGLSRLRIAFYALHKRGSMIVNGISPRFESFCVCRLSVSFLYHFIYFF